MAQLFLLAIMLLCLPLFVACSAGSGDGLDEKGRPLSEGGGNSPLEATFSSIQANVFTPICTSCHAGASAPLGLRLDAAISYALLVGVPSVEVPQLQRVAPNDPDNSYLIQKLEGTAAVGAQMPLGRPAVPQSTIDFIRQWITDGALPSQNPGSADSAPRVASLSPLPNSTVDRLPTQIFAVFDHEVDASTINADTFIVERSGGDNSFNEGNEVVIEPSQINLSSINPTLAILDLSGVEPAPDTYRMSLLGSGSTPIRDIAGAALDGEFTSIFPSGDGSAGGNFHAIFTVAGIQPSLESIQNEVFTPICSVCHTGPAGPNLPSGLNLSNLTASRSSLVNVPSVEVPSLLRVSPGNAADSYLIQKLEGNATVGGQMPLGGTPLSRQTIDVIRAWIDQGAE
jgi:hypothetical protein